MAMQCPICGAPVDGRECNYCGYKVPLGQGAKREAQQGPYQYARQPETDPYGDPYSRSGAGYGQDRNAGYGQNPNMGYGQNPNMGYGRNPYARNPYARTGAQDPYGRPISTRSKWVAFILCFLFGVLGVHRFYAGKIGTGLLWLFTGGLFGLGWIVDMIMILTGTFNDNHGFPLKE